MKIFLITLFCALSIHDVFSQNEREFYVGLRVDLNQSSSRIRTNSFDSLSGAWTVTSETLKKRTSLGLIPTFQYKNKKGKLKEWEVREINLVKNDSDKDIFRFRDDSIFNFTNFPNQFMSTNVLITNRSYWDLFNKKLEKLSLNLITAKGLGYSSSVSDDSDGSNSFLKSSFSFYSTINWSFGANYYINKKLLCGIKLRDFVRVNLGIQRTKNNNPSIPLLLREQTLLDFDQQIRISIIPKGLYDFRNMAFFLSYKL